MSTWTDVILKGLARVRVVHRLPGRLRLHVPLLTHLPDTWLPTIRLVERILVVPEGINTVRMEPRTGNVLVVYEPDILTESAILEALRAAMDWACRHRHRLADLDPAAADDMIDRFKATLENGIGDKLMDTLKARFPDVFWP